MYFFYCDKLISISFWVLDHLFSGRTTSKLPKLKQRETISKMFFRTPKQIYLKMNCENFIYMYFCIQGNSKLLSIKGTKVSTNGTNP